MRGPDRRRGSPPPRGRPFDGPARRPRSRSPDGYRRSPPPAIKRHRRDDDRFGGRDFPRRRGSYRDDDHRDRRGGYSPRRRGGAPMTYREFILTLHDDVSPEESKVLFEEYLADWYGSSIKAEFEARKGEAWMRKQFDPREMQKLIDQRNQLAADAAAAFTKALVSGTLDPTDEGFAQGDAEGGGPGPWPAAEAPQEGEDERVRTCAPAACNTPARVAVDVDLSRRLVATLDQQKGIAKNPLLVKREGEGEDGKQEGDGDGANGTEATTTPPIPLPTNPTHLLDLLLTYLWRVHGVDYYGCREYGGPDDPTRVGARRTLRPPPSTATSTAAAVKKEEGDGGAGAAGDGGDGGDGGLVKQEEKEGMDQDAGNGAAAGGDGDGDGKAGAAADAQHSVAAGVKKSDQEEGDAQIKLLDELWGHRLDMEDVLEKPLQKQRVEDAIQEWVEAQVVKHEENKWGCTLSTKLFVGKEYVLKHIRLKHPQRMAEERDKILDEVYWDNFREYKQREQEERRLREESAPPMQASMDASQMPVLPMLPGGLGGPLLGGGAILGAPMAGQVLVPAPGAGPLGPFVLAPAVAPAVDGIPGPAPPRGPPPGRGGRGGRGFAGGRGRGGRGRGGFAGGGYHDLDAPQNNRAVLDYSDL